VLGVCLKAFRGQSLCLGFMERERAHARVFARQRKGERGEGGEEAVAHVCKREKGRERARMRGNERRRKRKEKEEDVKVRERETESEGARACHSAIVCVCAKKLVC